jgi:hypothetical protein
MVDAKRAVFNERLSRRREEKRIGLTMEVKFTSSQSGSRDTV